MINNSNWYRWNRPKAKGGAMAFAKVRGLKGKVYIPEEKPGSLKKHPCRDCYSCQMCSDDRCNLCLKQNMCCRKKLIINQE